jgi:hypothetical protein
MNIGDKVRLLHGTEEGTIRRIIDKRTVEIEIEDGFLIPVLRQEIVKISADEETDPTSINLMTSGSFKKSSTEEDVHQKGIFLGITFEQNMISGWIINNSRDILLFAIHEKKADELVGLSHGVLNNQTYAKIADWEAGMPHKLPTLFVDIIKFENRMKEHTEPFSRKIDLRSITTDRERTHIPLLGYSGILIPMEDQIMLPDPEVIKEAFFTGEQEVQRKDKVIKEKIKEVDLHIEALSEEYQSLDSEDILNIQLSEFNTSLEKAVISGAEQIIFIHGVGNGILRNKIHKILSQYPHIKYFEDARKEKFGYGATKVQLK